MSDTAVDDFSDFHSSGKGTRKGTSKSARKASRKNDRNALSKLPIMHLVGHFLLFAFLLLFLMSLTRAGYAIWHLEKFDDTGTLLSVFWMGLRFDLALIGILMAVPVFIVPLFAMLRFLAILIFIAFTARLNSRRFLTYPVKVFPALCLSIIGLALCLYAARSSLHPLGVAMTPHSALVSGNSLVNEIALNTPYKSLYGFFIR